MTDPAREKPRRVRRGACVPQASLSLRAKKLIAEIDRTEVDVFDAQDRLSEKLEMLRGELGSSSFEHPLRGEMTIIFRGHWFWRAKPAGNPLLGQVGPGRTGSLF